MIFHYFDPYGTAKRIWILWFKGLKNTKKKVSKSKLYDGDSSIFKRFNDEIISRIEKSAIYKKYGIKDSRGIILYGVPGTGKTSAILAFKEHHKMNAYHIVAGMQSYQIRSIFETARQNTPSMIIMEDADGYLVSRSESGFNPLLTAILNEMDGDKDNSGVFVIMTTNFYEKLDPAILRNGRFDTHIELKPVENPDTAIEIIKAQFPNVNFDTEYLKRTISLPMTPAAIVGVIELASQRIIESGQANGPKLEIPNEVFDNIIGVNADKPINKTKIGFGR